MHLIISTSLNPNSRNWILTKHALKVFNEKGIAAEIIDLKDFDLPFCDGDTCYDATSVKELKEKITNSKSIIVASPIYNYDVNAVAKNLLELTGNAWTEKVVGFMCCAGGNGSYMSIMPFANSLMLDYRCQIIPRYVYTTGAAFEGRDVVDTIILERIEQLVDSILAAA